MKIYKIIKYYTELKEVIKIFRYYIKAYDVSIKEVNSTMKVMRLFLKHVEENDDRYIKFMKQLGIEYAEFKNKTLSHQLYSFVSAIKCVDMYNLKYVFTSVIFGSKCSWIYIMLFDEEDLEFES